MGKLFYKYNRLTGLTNTLKTVLSALVFSAAIALMALPAGAAQNMLKTANRTAAAPPSIAFYYGNNPPVDELNQFNKVVVEPANTSAQELAQLKKYGAKVLAYISVGEIDRWRQVKAQLSAGEILGQNKKWHSTVTNLTSNKWRKFLLNRKFKTLWEKGYDGFFLDTLDSYKLFISKPANIKKQQKALVSLLKTAHEKYPDAAIILNRGFDILPKVHQYIKAVAVESLFKGWNQKSKTYININSKDRSWLLKKLNLIKNKYHLPVIVIDYLPPDERKNARQDARKIQELGFIPYVTNSTLDQVGISSIEVMPRKVLLLYMLDNPADPSDDVAYQQVNALAAMPLEYLGYVPVYHNMQKPLPQYTLRGRYAGIIAWFNKKVTRPRIYQKWIIKQMQDGVPVVLMGNIGFNIDDQLLHLMGIKYINDIPSDSTFRVIKRDSMMGFEGKRKIAPPNEDGFWPVSSTVKAHLVLSANNHHKLATVLTGKFGGIALSPWLIQNAPATTTISGKKSFAGQQQRWLLNPFKFFHTALHTSKMPVVDPTTENGNRIASAHIDGDGFANRASIPGTPYSSEVIYKQILKKFKFPTTVSVIEGETGPDGLFPKQSPELEKIARKIFKLPSVEIASHTYSHPYQWLDIKPGMKSGTYNLPIPGYKFSFKKEIIGSVNYINTQLAPPGKKVKILLWSGDALPPLPAMRLIEKLGIAQMNGGNTDITKRYNTIANVSPMTRPVGPYTQVYAPDINEEVYTNGYHGPYWGFKQVIQTFKLTNKPRRLKPESIYYHIYSGARQSSVNAIKKVYEYVLSKPSNPMFESSYYKIVINYRSIGIAHILKGGWLITGATADRTLRLPKDKWPNLRKSPDVVGINDMAQGRYVALSGAEKVILFLQSKKPDLPFLKNANARTAHWQRTANGFDLSLRGQMPLKLTLANIQTSDHIHAPGAKIQRLSGQRVLISYDKKEVGNVQVSRK